MRAVSELRAGGGGGEGDANGFFNRFSPPLYPPDVEPLRGAPKTYALSNGKRMPVEVEHARRMPLPPPRPQEEYFR